MHVVVYRYLVAVLLLTPFSANASTITSAPKPTSTESVDVPKTCEFRTINYITDSLPQLCLKSSWSVANGTSLKASNSTATVDGHAEESITSSIFDAESVVQDADPSSIGGETTSVEPTSSRAVEAAEAAATDLETGELNEASFLSFEDWKKQTLDRAGQGSASIGNRKSGEGKKRDSESMQNNFETLGDEGEIDLDFGAFRSGGRAEDAIQTSENAEAEASQVVQEVEKRATKDQYRKKDAGITCKERFSYASFDAGATVLKTHPGAKNAKSVLIENKDSYMLSECSVENKFIIIELSEDIWIDTLVLANYEFFSSMIRTFRVSVSDRYPVKMEKWKDIGTYEARNSREIQAFLIENPQIWARYIRIEFLSHYGNEYYCPLSLVRVHGARMLESWKETEAGSDDDTDESQSAEEQFVPDAVAEVVQEEERLNAELRAQLSIAEPQPTLMGVHQPEATASMEHMTSPWEKPNSFTFDIPKSSPLNGMCHPSEAPTETSPAAEVTSADSSPMTESPQTSIPSPTATISHANLTESTTITSEVRQPDEPHTIESSFTKESSPVTATASNATYPASATPTPSLSTTAVTSKSQNVTNSLKNRTSSTSSAASSLPTIQESFFKAVSRRLQLLETNSTLSLKYIEEQSKILREAFTKVEKKQLQKTTTYLDTLNSTVLTELQGFRQQYDEIWQSTVISLESQRDKSRREILAITTRLNILADEVVFQKRMSIVQSILLLLCLGLVIFSRVSGGGTIDLQTVHSRGHSRSRQLATYVSRLKSPLDGSLPASPDFPEANSGRWLEPGHRRQLSDETAVSRSRSRDESPPTPISTYSRSDDHALTPPSGADDLNTATTADLLSDQLESDGHLHPNASKASLSSYHSTSENAASSPIRTPKKRKAFIRQQDSPPEGSESFNSFLPSPQPNPEEISYEQEPATPHVELALLLEQEPTRLPSPPLEPVEPEIERSPPPPQKPPHSHNTSPRFSIARKPLPALPPDGS